jgi:hypothetical protein
LTDEIGIPIFSHYLCFSVKVRTNKFVYSQTDKYTPQQEELHDTIKSMNDSGMSYRRITQHLNEKGILTHKGKKWGISGNSVYSVLKRNKERLERIAYRDKEYEPEWGKMEVRWEKN